MPTIYILELKNDKYYIGKTSYLEIRLNSHFIGNGSKWTQLYPPVSILKIIKNCSDSDEDKYTEDMMNKYGIANVRGGTYSTIILSEQEIFVLNKKLNTIGNKCYKCNKSGHFAKECKVKLFCERCHRNSHTVSTCYATTTLDGKHIESFIINKKRKSETAVSICKKNIVKENIISKPNPLSKTNTLIKEDKSQCDCINSYMFPHRKYKCVLKLLF